MNSKIIYLLLIPFLLAGCTKTKGDDEGDKKDTGNYLIKEDVSIEFLCMADSSYYPSLQKIVNDFMESEPHVKVRLYNPPGSGYYTAIDRIIISGFFKEDYPDLAQCYPDNVFKYIAQGYAYNVDDFLNNQTYGILGEDRADYIEEFLLEGSKYQAKGTYSLPFCKSTELLYYNAETLLGLDLNEVDSSINNGKPLDEQYLDSLTWEELFDRLCPAIYNYNESQDDEHKIYDNSLPNSAIVTYDSDENFFITLANQYGYGYAHKDDDGKGVIDFDNGSMKSLLKKLHTAKENKYLITRGSNHNKYVSSLFTERNALFTISSTAGMSYNFNYKNPFVLGVGHLPYPEGKSYSSINQGPSLCIFDHHDDNRALASFLLWKYLTNKENSSYWNLETGYMGIRSSSYQSEEYIKTINPEDTNDKEAISKANNLKKINEVRNYTFSTDIFRGSSNTRSNVGILLKEVLLSDGEEETINSLFSFYAEETRKYL